MRNQDSRYASIIMAFLLVTTGAVTFWNYHSGLEMYSSLKVEMPALTMLCLQCIRSPLVVPLTAIGLGVAFATALSRRWAWSVGLLMSLAMLVANFAMLLPSLSFMNGLNGDPATAPSAGLSNGLYMQALLGMGWNLITSAIFGLSLFSYRSSKRWHGTLPQTF